MEYFLVYAGVFGLGALVGFVIHLSINELGASRIPEWDLSVPREPPPPRNLYTRGRYLN